jgi:hypothetical protein
MSKFSKSKNQSPRVSQLYFSMSKIDFFFSRSAVVMGGVSLRGGS